MGRADLDSRPVKVLERIAAGAPLDIVLDGIVDIVERRCPGGIGSVLLLDRDGVHVRHGAAPHLPAGFITAIDGASIGPNEGSCGAAAYRRERVVVDDIATHPNWAVYKAVALPFGLRACWSTPILSRTKDVLGTFAVYYREPRAPTSDELAGMDVATHLAAIAIERHRAEETRKRDEARIASQAALLDKAHDAIVVLSFDGTITYWNKASERVFGYEASEAIGQRLRDLIAIEPSQADRLRADVLARGEATFEVSATTRTKQTVTVEASVTVVDDDRGAQSFLLICTDITERKSFEAQFMRAQRLESLGTLAGGVAHDFNNILTAILGNASIALQLLPADDAARPAIAEIEKASSRAAELTRRILAFSRRQVTVREPIRLWPIVEEALTLLRATLPATIEFRASSAEDVPCVLGDAVSIHQVVMNLGTNAAHAMSEHGGVLEVKVDVESVDAATPMTVGNARPGKHAVLRVSDTGAGMDRATLDRMFEPFFTTKGVQQGTGLGLSVVHGVMTTHEGAIAVASEVGHGTTLRLYFPAVEADVAKPEARPRTAKHGHGERILVVDDEEAILRVAARTLEALGFVVLRYADPRRAIEAIERNPAELDCLLTDASMPGMSGIDFAASVRGLRPDVPIVVMSGYWRDEDEARARAIGVAELVMKPASFDAVAATLRRVIDAARAKRDA
jgi:PAS domain S-box-containing protein